MEYVSWTRMEDGTQEDWNLLNRIEADFNADHADRLMTHLKALDVDWGGYRINRYQHSLQSATLAERDGADDEMIFAALFHDIGDILSPYNHSEMAAAVVRPFVSDRIYWIVKHHGLFQGYYYDHFLGGDRNARDRFKDHEWFDDCIHFCANYDQNAFDPDYDTLPLEHFEPLIRRVCARSKFGHMELASTAS